MSPINAASDVLDRAGELLRLDVAATPSGVREDLRRQAWVMGVAAIDTYLHWSVHRVNLEKPLPKELSATAVPLSDLIDLAKTTVAARQKPKKQAASAAASTSSTLPATSVMPAANAEAANIRPMVRVRNALHRAILKQTFQGSGNVKKALSMLGVNDCWRAIGGIVNQHPSQVTDYLDAITRRRNSIAHEGDIERQSRPQQIKRHPIGALDVSDMLSWVRAFVTAIDTLVP